MLKRISHDGLLVLESLPSVNHLYRAMSGIDTFVVGECGYGRKVAKANAVKRLGDASFFQLLLLN